VSLIFVGALAVAAMNVAMGRSLERQRAFAGEQFWQRQFAGFVFRFITIFGTACLIWIMHHRLPEVAVFIVTGAVAQMSGQIYFLTKDKKPNA